MTQIRSRTIEIAAGDTVAVEFLKQVFPISYSVIPGSGATQTRSFSCAPRPGSSLYVSPPNNARTTAAVGSAEAIPFSFLRVAASGGTVSLSITGHLADKYIVHTNDDTITGNAIGDVALGVGDTHEISVQDAFDSVHGSLAVSVASADSTKVSASADPNTGTVTVGGVAAGTDITVTLTATNPAGATATATVDVTVA